MAAGATAALLAGLWLWAAARYAESGDFTLLHVVTGLRAVQALLPWADDAAAVAAVVPAAVAAALLASGWRGRGAGLPQEPVDWPAVVAAVLAQDDDHVIKLVHAAREGARRHPSQAAVFGAAALRALG